MKVNQNLQQAIMGEFCKFKDLVYFLAIHEMPLNEYFLEVAKLMDEFDTIMYIGGGHDKIVERCLKDYMGIDSDIESEYQANLEKVKNIYEALRYLENNIREY